MSLAAPWHAAGRRLMRMMAVAGIESSRLAKDRVAMSLIALYQDSLIKTDGPSRASRWM